MANNYYVIYNSTTHKILEGGYGDTALITAGTGKTLQTVSDTNPMQYAHGKGYWNGIAPVLYTAQQLADQQFADLNSGKGYGYNYSTNTITDGRTLSQARAEKRIWLREQLAIKMKSPYTVSVGPPTYARVPYDGPFNSADERELLNTVGVDAEKAKRTSDSGWSWTYFDTTDGSTETLSADDILSIISNQAEYMRQRQLEASALWDDIENAATVNDVDDIEWPAEV